MLCVCVLKWSSVAQLLIGKIQDVNIYRSILQAWNQEGASCCTKGDFIGVCFCMSVFTCGTEVEEVIEEHREPVCANESEKYCVQKACDCVCVSLNYLAQRPDRGVNEVRSSLLQRFPSLHPSFSTPTSPLPPPPSLQSSSFILSVLINRNLLTKGFPHVTHVPPIIGKPWREKHRSN